MAEIARRTGVCKATVSLALRNDPQIPPATRERIERAATELGYARNPVVAQLMAELRKVRPIPRSRTIALINAHRNAKAFTEHPTVPIWVEGCRRRAALLGYGTDEFWLHDPETTPERLEGILRARGIAGMIVLGSFGGNHLPEQFSPLWANLACVVGGVRTRQPTFSYCCVDHHTLVVQAVKHVCELGYRRPALVIDEATDRLVGGRFGSAMWLAQSALPARDRVPAFLSAEEARRDPRVFRRWYAEHQPDLLITFYREIKDWLAPLGVRVPQDAGVVLLERTPADKAWAGMDQRNDLAGEAAVDLLVGMIHGREFGPTETPRATMIDARWIDGASVQPQAIVRAGVRVASRRAR